MLFAGFSVPKLFSVLRTINFTFMTAYTKHGKISSAKKNGGRKPKVNERDCVELSKQHISTVKRNTAYLQVFTLFCPTLVVSTQV